MTYVLLKRVNRARNGDDEEGIGIQTSLSGKHSRMPKVVFSLVSKDTIYTNFPSII